MNKNILIIYPHFPPSNLAGVHRPRLFARYLPVFGWEPIILTVNEEYYTEKLDWSLVELLPKNLRIEKVSAFRPGRLGFIGDLGLRAFIQLYRKALAIIRNERISFIYIPIPSFYCAMLGRLLYSKTKVSYGIDYIDPWVHFFPGSEKVLSRHWFSTKLAKFLEPIAIKKASLITGVAEGYYKGVIDRNPRLLKRCVFGAMPYGGEVEDHKAVDGMNKSPSLFPATADKVRLVYAGAMLPKAYKPLEVVFRAIKNNPALFTDVEFHFIGTGKTPDDENGFNIKPLAEKYRLWQTIVYEYPKRIPYLEVLVHLHVASGIFILGSTEPHYTPSKVYQGVLSGKPILAVLHKESSAAKVIGNSGAGLVLSFTEQNLDIIESGFPKIFNQYLAMLPAYDVSKINMETFENYSAKNVTKKLAELLNTIV